MLYLTNTTEPQAALIPKNGIEALGELRLEMRSSVNHTTTAQVALDLIISDRYFNLTLTLPEGMADGEYTYKLMGGDALLSSGVLVIQPSAPRQKNEYNKVITYEQYEC